MNRGKDPPVSLCEKKFILEAIKESKRIDGREVYDYREINVSLGKEPGHVEVTLGRTRVLARVSCQVIQPKPQRPTEGVIFFNVELSPMASPSFETGRPSSMSVEISRILDRCQRDSRAVDTESLCIIAGQKVWEIRIDLHVLDHCGNIIDCASIAAITALKHFRRPDVTVVGEEATIHPASERDPVPLSVYHMPICFTFAFFLDGEYMLVDPSLEEENIMEGKLVVGMNIHREICVLQMMGGVAILPEQVMRCTQIAAVKCVEITEMIKNFFSGKTVELSENFESILQSKRKVEEIDRDLHSDDLKAKQEEPMDVGREDQVNYLGPGTAELVGLGGDSTWEVLDSIKELSDEGLKDMITTKPKNETALKKGKKTKKKENKVKDDSEEEETMELTKTDITEVPPLSKTEKPLSPKKSKSREVLDSVATDTKKMRTVGTNGSGSKKAKRKSKDSGDGVAGNSITGKKRGQKI